MKFADIKVDMLGCMNYLLENLQIYESKKWFHSSGFGVSNRGCYFAKFTSKLRLSMSTNLKQKFSCITIYRPLNKLVNSHSS